MTHGSWAPGVNGKHFEHEAFRQKRQRHDNHVTYPRRHVGCTQAYLLRSQISPVLCGRKAFDTLSELKRRIRVFSCVKVWNGSSQTRSPHKRHESSEPVTTD